MRRMQSCITATLCSRLLSSTIRSFSRHLDVIMPTFCSTWTALLVRRVPRSASLASRASRVARALYAIRVSRGSAHAAHYVLLAFLVLVAHRCGCRCVDVGVYHRGLARPRTVLGTVSGHLLLRAERARARDTSCWTCVRFSLPRVSLLSIHGSGRVHPHPFSNIPVVVVVVVRLTPAFIGIWGENTAAATKTSEYKRRARYEHSVTFKSLKVARRREKSRGRKVHARCGAATQNVCLCWIINSPVKAV